MLFLILFAGSLANFIDSMLLVHGPKTPSGLKSKFNNTFSFYLSSTTDPIDHLFTNFPSFILDVSLDPTLFVTLDSISNYFGIPYLTITKTPDFQYSSNRFFIFPPIQQEAEALVAMIKYLEWKEFSIISSNMEENLNILEILKNSLTGFQIKQIIYDKKISEDNLDMLVKRLLKAKGVKKMLVLDQGSSLALFIKVLKLRKIEKYGNYFLFGVGSFEFFIEGSAGISYEVGKNADSIEQFYAENIFNVISKLNSFTLEDFYKICELNLCLKSFVVVNIKNNEKVEVGTVKGSLNITKEIVFPGNNSNKSVVNPRKKLPIMIANGTAEPNNYKNNRTSYIFNGAFYAAEIENSAQEFQEFEFEFIPTDCGNLYYDLQWCTSCLSKVTKNLGLAYISGFWSDSSLANALSLKTLKTFVPQISTSSLSGFMNNKTLFPEFLTMVGDPIEFVRNSLIMFQFYNWKDVIIIAGNGTLDRLRLNFTIKNLEEIGIRVINTEEFRYLPENYTRDDFNRYKFIFEYVRDTKCRVVFFLINPISMILEGFYDVGLRRGDLIIVSYIKNIYSFDYEQNEVFRKKQLEIFDRSLLSSFLEYDTEYGKEIQKELNKRYSPTINMCNTFDSFLTVSNSIKYLMSKGEDFEDPYKLINAMRNQRYIGCSGNVFFVRGENFRSTQWASYIQVVVNSTTNDYDFIQFLALSKFSVIAARQINKPIWPTGEETVPSNYRIKSNCVYSNYKQKSKYGLLQLHIVSIILFLITVVTAYSSQKFFNGSLPDITKNSLPSYQDMLYQFFFICEFFQILALDHQNGVVSRLSNEYNYLAGLDLVNFFHFKDDQFWGFQLYLIAIVLLYSLFFTFKIVVLKIFNKKFNCLDFFIENILPIVGHIGYMPIILMVFNIYQCEEGITDLLTDSFLSNDCYKFCYRGKHLTYVIISSSSLLLFLIFSTFFRPFWEIIQVGLRIRTKPAYLSIISIFQVMLVILKVNLEPYSRVKAGYSISGILICLIFITYKLKPFNYDKITAYQITLLSMDFWAIFVSTLFYHASIENYSEFALVSGLFLLFVLGTIFSKHSDEIFVSDEPNLIPDLIKFQFSPDKNRVRPESKYIARDDSEISIMELRDNHSSIIT